ncbi:hypothetical protein [Palleronia sp. LCG004]|uniref:5-carboxymethyl-2-hydroxymuconate Delta-isomerase n=1 Tax=Palleronia sp. LCG004 TaxID=3079304 RepID=UPI0029432285|nr:hypothetical protein [Palleronia sp. LCG004]WOI57871.1 hypothetical protein RVY76_14770 [Palleronia sp. LCG004]
MPHLVIEHFPEIDGTTLCRVALDVAARSGIMRREDIKVRTQCAGTVLLGDGRSSFLHVTVSLLAGREDAAKLALSDALVCALRDAFPDIEAISADIRDMDPYCYRKSLTSEPGGTAA